MIEIDGSYGEGGGQILRTAISLSAITGKEARIYNIRAGREAPGLKMQHLTGIRAVKDICSAEATGLKVGSAEVMFKPGRISPGNYTFDTGTAGSTTLILQTVLPVLMFAGGKSMVEIIGGTHVPKSPTFEEASHVLLPILKNIGVNADVSIQKYGFYPKGGGRITLTVEPAKRLEPIELTEHIDSKINGTIVLCNLPEHIAKREREAVLKHFNDADISLRREGSLSPGNAVILYSECRGVHSLGEIGKSAESVAEDACAQMKRELPYCVDRHTADQLLLYMALAKGESSIKTSEITLHAKTNIWVLEQFLERKFSVEDNLIKCE